MAAEKERNSLSEKSARDGITRRRLPIEKLVVTCVTAAVAEIASQRSTQKKTHAPSQRNLVDHNVASFSLLSFFILSETWEWTGHKDLKNERHQGASCGETSRHCKAARRAKIRCRRY